jgi:hypothetical protein
MNLPWPYRRIATEEAGGGIVGFVEYLFRKPTGSPADRGATPPRWGAGGWWC